MNLLNRTARNIVVKVPKRNFIALPSGRNGTVIGGLIGTNVVVWAGWKYAEQEGRSSYQQMINHFTITRNKVFSYPHTLITSTFSHMVIYHITSYFYRTFILFIFCKLMFFNLTLSVFMHKVEIKVLKYITTPPTHHLSLSLSLFNNTGWLSFVWKYVNIVLFRSNMSDSTWC